MITVGDRELRVLSMRIVKLISQFMVYAKNDTDPWKIRLTTRCKTKMTGMNEKSGEDP